MVAAVIALSPRGRGENEPGRVEQGAVTMFSPRACPRLIVKVGSALLVDPDGTVRREWLTSLVADIAARTKAGQEIAVVSSGAIALGARRLKLPKGGRASLEDAQAAAATGQIALSQVWAELLGAEGLTAAQMLVNARRSRGSPALSQRRRDAQPPARARCRAGHQRE